MQPLFQALVVPFARKKLHTQQIHSHPLSRLANMMASIAIFFSIATIALLLAPHKLTPVGSTASASLFFEGPTFFAIAAEVHPGYSGSKLEESDCPHSPSRDLIGSLPTTFRDSSSSSSSSSSSISMAGLNKLPTSQQELEAGRNSTFDLLLATAGFRRESLHDAVAAVDEEEEEVEKGFALDEGGSGDADSSAGSINSLLLRRLLSEQQQGAKKDAKRSESQPQKAKDAPKQSESSKPDESTKQEQKKSPTSAESDEQSAESKSEDATEENVASYLRSADDKGQKFIYVYDFGSEFTDELKEQFYQGMWWPTEYEAEEAILDMIMTEGVARTDDPEEASLFYVPVLFSRAFVIGIVQNGGSTAKAVKDMGAFAARVVKILESKGPWFRRNNGRDHFAVLAMDHGRCSVFTYGEENDVDIGEMFFLQTNGDRRVRSNFVTQDGDLSALLYNRDQPPSADIPSIKCYDERRDIVIPPKMALQEGVEPKVANERLVATFRFWPHQYRMDGHRIRQELYDTFEPRNNPGWVFGAKSHWKTNWGLANFTVCPPGKSQWTSRPFKALLAGSIPITFFRYNDNPWQDLVEYDKFSINIDPEVVWSLEERINEFYMVQGLMASFQGHMQRIEEHFRWDKGLKRGALQLVLDALKQKACQVGSNRDRLGCPQEPPPSEFRMQQEQFMVESTERRVTTSNEGSSGSSDSKAAGKSEEESGSSGESGDGGREAEGNRARDARPEEGSSEGSSSNDASSAAAAAKVAAAEAAAAVSESAAAASAEWPRSRRGGRRRVRKPHVRYDPNVARWVATAAGPDMRAPADDHGMKFVYVYDFGGKFTWNVLQRESWWWSPHYESEEMVYDLIFTNGVMRTKDPEKASLFYIPIFHTRMLIQSFSEREFELSISVRDAGRVWNRLLQDVKQAGPWFERNNGRDHFSVIAHDHGRCSAFTFAPEGFDVKEMFFLQSNGDRIVRSNHVNSKGSMITLLYNDHRPPSSAIKPIKCCHLTKDIIIPPVVRTPPVDPRTSDRPKLASFLFAPHGFEFLGHNVSEELYQLFKDKDSSEWFFSAKNEKHTDWTESFFCVCPPGHSQWTSRVYIAIMKGCIPVTFFRDNKNPWQSELNYSEFSINIDPTKVHTLEDRIKKVANDKERLNSFLTKLVEAQEYFRWDDGLKNGVLQHIVDALFAKACKVGANKESLPCPKT